MRHHSRTPPIRLAWFWLFACLLSSLFVTSIAAQSTSPGTPPQTTTPIAPPAEDVIYLPDEQGILRRVPLSASLKEYLAFQKQLTAGNEDAVSTHSIQSLDIQGQLVTLAESRQFADLVINLDVQLYQSNWTLINLKLQELVFTEPVVHQGPGEMTFQQRDRLQGITLWLKGKGVHRLQFKGMLPIRTQQLWKRLQLTLPASTVSEFRMLVPATSVQLRDVERYPLAQAQPREDSTQIRLVDLQERLDLSWLEETQTGQAEPLVNVFNNLQVRIIEQQLEMNLVQRLEVSQDALSTLTFELPAGWDYYDVKLDRGTITRQQPTTTTGGLQIELERPLTGRVELNWLLRRPMPSLNENLIIAPVVFMPAKRQVTEISLQDHPEWQFQMASKSPTSEPTANAPTIRQSSLGPVYQFRSVPARLSVLLTPRMPTYSTALTAAFFIEKQQARLTVYLDVKVTQGILRSLQLHWPAQLDRQWKLQPTADFQIKLNKDSSDSQARELTLTRSISDAATITLEFTRPLLAEESPFTLTWPTLSARPPLESFLAMTDSRQVETSIDAERSRLLAPIPRSLWQATYAVSTRLTPLTRLYTIPATLTELPVTRTLLEQDITARIETALERQDDALRIAQSIKYRIEWSGVRQFDLDAPADFSGTLLLSQQGNSIISQQENMPLEGGRKRLRLYTDQPLLGDVTLSVDSRQSISPDANSPLVVGLIRPLASDVFITGSQITTSSSGSHGLILNEASAHSLGINPAGEQVYSLPEAPLAVSLDMTASTFSSSTLEIRSSRLLTRMVALNRVTTRSDYLLTGASRVIRFSLPNNCRVSRVLWDAVPLPVQTSDMTSSHTTYTGLAPAPTTSMTPTQPSANSILTIDYQTDLPGPRFGLWNFNIPQPDLGIIADLATHVWRLEIFPQQHLFGWNSNLRPLFQWTFHSGVWVRQNLLPNKFPVENNETSSNFHQYDFELTGRAELRTQTISQSLLLLVGVGGGMLTSLLALLLLRSSRLPSLVLLILSLALSAAYLQGSIGGVLVQPFLAGAAMGLLALIIDRRFFTPTRRLNYPSRPVTATATIGGSSITYHGRAIDWEAMAGQTLITSRSPATATPPVGSSLKDSSYKPISDYP